MTANSDFQDEAEKIRSCGFIRVVYVKEHKAVDVLRRSSGLNLGESEAIVFADDSRADVLLMDEARGRQVAKNMGLYIMGTVGVLLFAYEEKLLTGLDVEDALEKLRKADRHISDDIFNYALNRLR